MSKLYFDYSEFASVELPIEKKQNIIQKAIQWIKERKEKYQQRNEDVKEQAIEKEDIQK